MAVTAIRWARRNEVLANLLVAGAVAAGLTAVIWRLAIGGGWSWPAGVLAWLVAVNLTAFAAYRYDKWQAGRGGRRIPELVLHALALAGGTIGALVGMKTARHKTLKGPFQAVFWTTAAAQLMLAGYALKAWVG